MKVPAEAGAANYVPAAAVIHRLQALFGITGRKASVGGSTSRLWNLPAQPGGCGRNCRTRVRGESGIPGVAVKCVDIRRNIGGEDGSLDRD